MKCDYHIHPNLLAKNPERRLRKLWKAIDVHQLDVIICAEHVYKNAPDAYRRMVETRPRHMRTHVFPGAELVTSDGKGIDIIAFAEEDWYNRYSELLKPFSMSLVDMIRYLDQTELSYFIPHPIIPGNPLKKLFPSKDAMDAFLGRMPAVEVFNGSFIQLEKFFRGMFLHVWEKKFGSSMRLDGYDCSRHQFVAVGSDAHHPNEIGVAVEIWGGATVTDRHCAFEFLTHNTNISRVTHGDSRFSLAQLLYTGWTTFSEWWIKREWRMYDYHHTVFSLSQNAPIFTSR